MRASGTLRVVRSWKDTEGEILRLPIPRPVVTEAFIRSLSARDSANVSAAAKAAVFLEKLELALQFMLFQKAA